jgi:hypothetical protein
VGEIAASRFPSVSGSPQLEVLANRIVPSSQTSPSDEIPAVTSPIIENQHQKVEVGFVTEIAPEPFRLRFERCPIWLLALEPSVCSSVHLPEVPSANALLGLLHAGGHDPTLYNRSVGRLGVGRMHYGDKYPAPEGIITLLSGSYPFLQHAASSLTPERTLLLLDEPWRGKTTPKFSNGVTWRRFKPAQFGGSTSYPVLLGSSGFTLSPRLSILSRSIGHILDHGIRPDHLPLSVAASLGSQSLDFYTSGSLLDPRYLERPVAYETTYSSSRWGSRKLTADEIGASFGLPARLSFGGLNLHMFPIVPLQVLSGCLDSLSSTIARLLQPLDTPAPRVLGAIPTFTWLPTIGKRLDHSWIDHSTVSAKAAKNDSARVATHMWDQRVLLPLPSIQDGLPFLRSRIMRFQRCRLYSEFRAFMRETHGADWLHELTSLRARLHPILQRLRTTEDPSGQQGGVKGFKGKTKGSKGQGVVKSKYSNSSKKVYFKGHQKDSELKRKRGAGFSPSKKTKLARDIFASQRDTSSVPPPTSPETELLRDATVGTSVLSKICNSDWWSWNRGSTLAFWRWPPGEQRRATRDGMETYLQSKPPSFREAAAVPKKEAFDLLLPKFQSILERGYVVSNQDASEITELEDFIMSYIDYFGVPKADDIRVVYNGSSCGLNPTVWAPNFWLPTGKSATRVLNYNYCGVDLDLGEFFLNFPLPMLFRRFSGIDLTAFKDKLGYSHVSDKDFQLRWERCWMGFKPSPYYSTRFYYWAEEFARGDRREKLNPLRWDEVRLNLPGDPSFDPTLPRVMKWDRSIDNIAGDVLTFVDDSRASGMDEEVAWRIARQVASRLQYLGIQDAPRKRRPPTRKPGAWAGAIFSTTDGLITQTVSQEKWNKGRDQIKELSDELDKGTEALFNYKRLEQIRGFLCHLSMTFESITPFLKGFHLSLSSHLPSRDDDGWKLPDRAFMAYIYDKQEKGLINEEEARSALNPPDYEDIPVPKTIKPVSRFRDDVFALGELLSAPSPPLVVIRSNFVYEIFYGFGDASGKGFGSTMLSKRGIKYRIGLWGDDEESETSNWKEFQNQVEALEEEALGGHLANAMVFFFTDNSTVEACLYKGNSSSPKLFKLMVRMRKLEMTHNVNVIISHVSGKRMIKEGADGVSRGYLREGVTAGESMLGFIPTDEGPLSRAPKLKAWVESWVGKSAEFLSPDDWFERAHDHRGGTKDSKGFWRPRIVKGTFIWTLPPGAAEAALEELRKARLKRQRSMHVILCPRLLTPEWLKQLYKASDLVLSIPAGTDDYWPLAMCEPLTIGLVFPFINRFPWQLRGTPKMFAMARKMRSVFEAKDVAAGNLLRKFLLECQRLRTVSQDVVRGVLYFESRGGLPHSNYGGRTGTKRKEPEGRGADRESLGQKKPKEGRLHQGPKR